MDNQPNDSSLSLQSSTTVGSTTPSRIRAAQRPQKDYAAAFGTLQSRYGTGGLMISPKKEPSKKLPQYPPSQHSSSSSMPPSTPAQSSGTTLTPSSILTEGSETSSDASRQMDNGEKKRKSILVALFKGKKDQP